jgi:hypothetical protein
MPNATSPWQRPPGDDDPERDPKAPLSDVEAIYAVLWRSLNLASRAAQDLPVTSALVALIDLAADLSSASGLLWTQPDFVAALRDLADKLEARRDRETAPPLHTTVRETLASVRPATPAN